MRAERENNGVKIYLRRTEAKRLSIALPFSTTKASLFRAGMKWLFFNLHSKLE
jgi:hypothetical protein